MASMFSGYLPLDAAMLFFWLMLPVAVGLPPLLVILDSVYVMTGREIWKQIARFWGELFGIAVAAAGLGAAVIAIACAAAGGASGNTIAVVSAIVCVVLVVEWLLYRWCFREWWQLSRLQHLAGSLGLLALPNIAVLAVAALIGWLPSAQDAAGGNSFLAQLPALLASFAVQTRFVHLACACYLIAAGLLLSISAWYLLRRRNVQIAHRSMTVAASFGLASALALAVQGAIMVPDMPIGSIAAVWCFRAMIIVGAYLLVLFAWGFYLASRRRLQRGIFLRFAFWSISLPWIAAALGWFVFGSQRAVPENTSQAAIAALVSALVVLALVTWAKLRILRLVRGGPEQLKLWPADAGKIPSY